MPTSTPQSTTCSPAPVDAIIMAGGKGTRMQSDLPKVLLEVAGRPMVNWVVDACLSAGCERVIVVVGYRGELVRDTLRLYARCHFVEQREQLGTGHAARMAAPLFDPAAGRDVFVLAGDGPLIRSATLRQLLATHRQRRAAATLATAVLDDPSGYGRVVRAADGSLDRIVEQKDASPAELAVREVNPSYYCFRSDELMAGLERIKPNNKQGEYYLTDVPPLLKAQGRTIALVDAVPAQDVLSINTPQQLAQVDQVLRQRLRSALEGTGR